MDDSQRHQLLLEFLETWPEERIRNMSLEEYVSVGNQETFTQWVENRAYELGSIKGHTSSMFGIYKRRNPVDRPKNVVNDEIYSWRAVYSQSDRNDAFTNIKNEILSVLRYAKIGDFASIDQLHLTHPYKWKLAFLFSNERLVPLYKQEWLLFIASHLGMGITNKTPFSAIHTWIIDKKPIDKTVYAFARILEGKFHAANPSKKTTGKFGANKKSRKPAQSRNTDQQTRKGAESYIANQLHNQIQLKLFEVLKARHGDQNVFLEDEFVDIKVIAEDSIHLYEVKSNPYPDMCIREALGQILMYSYRNKEIRKKKLIVIGQFPPNEEGRMYIEFVKKSLNIDFDYQHLDLSDRYS